MEAIKSFLKPENLRSVSGLELVAKQTAAGILSGLNRSYRTGVGQEFSQYRTYQPGDDLRQLDWKLYARSDRFYVREAEVETNIQVHFILDASASMRHEDNGFQKIDYARYLIATLAWLVHQQGDAIGLFALNDSGFHHLRPKIGRRFFQRFLYELTQVDGVGKFPTKGKTISQLQIGQKKDMVLFISDMYEQETELTRNIQLLSQFHNEVILFHILGQNELTFDYQGASSFEDLETGRIIQADHKLIQKDYQTKFQERLQQIQKQMLEYQVTYEQVQMNNPIGNALRQFLKKRTSLI